MKYRVCINESPAQFMVEAESQEEALKEARQCLHDWADQTDLEIDCEGDEGA